MKRQTKFRGWSIEKEEWVYGLLQFRVIQFPNGSLNEWYVIQQIIKSEEGRVIEVKSTPIVYDTVGQFINAYGWGYKELYEGDIVSNGNFTGVIEYQPQLPGWIVRTNENKIHDLNKSVMFGSEKGIMFEDWEVIGNIHSQKPDTKANLTNNDKKD